MIRAMRLLNLQPRLASVHMGRIPTINAIPTSITFELVTPASKSREAWNQISTLFNIAMAKSPDDKDAELKMEEVESHEAGRRVLREDSTDTLGWFLKDIPNGVITSADGFPERVKTSSSLGYLEMAASGDQMSLQLAAMPRSFDNRDLDALVDQIKLEAEQHFPFAGTKVETYARTSPWLADPACSRWAPHLRMSTLLRSECASPISLNFNTFWTVFYSISTAATSYCCRK
jgi:hypothetical protein